MILNDAGIMVEKIWNEIPVYYNGFDPRQFVVMPNHIHGIIEIVVGAGPRACPVNGQPQGVVGDIGQPRGGVGDIGQPRGVAPTGLGDIVHRLKTLTTKRYIDGVKNNGWQRFNGKLWQRNYWERIVRNENEYQKISEYIINNPLKWDTDKLNNDATNTVMEPKPNTPYTR